MQTIYEAAGGHQGMLRLASAWHQRVMADEVVSHAFRGGTKADHLERLAAYWGEALGGPCAPAGDGANESAVVRLHSDEGEHQEMDRRAIACFDLALQDAGLADNQRLATALHDYFAWVTTVSFCRYPRSRDDVPEGLVGPRWSWQGMEGGAARP